MHPISKKSSIGLFALRAPVFVLLAFLFAWATPWAGASTDDADEIKDFLNQTILWYRQLAPQQQLVSEPSDVLFLNDNRQLTNQVVKLSFDFARMRAQALDSQKPGAPNSSAPHAKVPGPNQQGIEASRYRTLADRAAKTDQQAEGLQRELVNFRKELASAQGKRRGILEAIIDETEGELTLVQAHREAIQNMLRFVGTAAYGPGQGGLQGEIEELARTIPAASTTANSQEPETAAASSHDSASMAITTAGLRKDEQGIFVLVTELFALKRKLNLLGEALQQTDALAGAATALRAPLAANLREMGKRGDDVMNQPDSQDPVVLAQQRKELDGITAQFKQVSATTLPLGKQSVLLDLYRQNSTNWRNAVQAQYSTAMKALMFRLGLLALALAMVFGMSEVVRRVTFRYVQDVRRQHQFLLLRRIVVSCVVTVMVIVAAISGLGSVTTFAGLLTAGIAVALQNVILAIAGYFFLIGKYGVRVGDRIQVSGVTGDVIDIGLMRLHIVEVGSGLGPRATGRVVAFSNAVVFQPGGFFKQIPGTSFVWHEVALTLPADGNYAQAEEKMLAAVNRIFADYREKMELQHRNMERAVTAVPISSLRPDSRLRLMDNGLQVVIRYPVEMESASEIDDRVTRAVLEAK